MLGSSIRYLAENVCFRKLISGTHGNVTLEVTDTTGSHQFPAMRRLSVVRGDHAILTILTVYTMLYIILVRTRLCHGLQHLIQTEPH